MCLICSNNEKETVPILSFKESNDRKEGGQKKLMSHQGCCTPGMRGEVACNVDF